jgi:hypothetical protein
MPHRLRRFAPSPILAAPDPGGATRARCPLPLAASVSNGLGDPAHDGPLR